MTIRKRAILNVVGSLAFVAFATIGPARAAPICEPGWVERVYRERITSIVRIETTKGIGAGFFYGTTQRHIVTAYHVIATGHELRVVLADGRKIPAQVIATGEADDLAILELEVPVPEAKPLVAASGSPATGASCVALGHPLATHEGGELAGLLSWSATAGIVGGHNANLVQTDAPIAPGYSGGPLLDCGGDVLGVVSFGIGSGVTFAVSANLLPALEARAVTAPEVYSGGGVESLGQLGVAFEFEPDHIFTGLELNRSWTVADHWSTDVRLAAYFWSGSAKGVALTQSGTRYEVELGERYRLNLSRRAHFFLNFGVGIVWRTTTLRQTLATVVADDPACTVGCSSHVEANGTSTSSGRFPLVFFSGVDLFGIELSYAYLLKTKGDDVSSHRVAVTFSF